MREKNRKPIASIKKLPQFTTMNVIDGQAGLISYFSLIFYSLTIDNILNIIIIIILSTVAISFAFGDNGLIKRAEDAGDYYANDTAYTEESITNVEAYLDEALGNVKIVQSADETPVAVPVPKGFTASNATEEEGRKAEKTVAGGFVIYQGEEAVTNENVEEAQKTRNQFV